MNKFKLLSAEKVLQFKVSEAIANDPNNLFFGKFEFPRDTDGPWPIFAAILQNRTPKVLSFHLNDLFPEAYSWEEYDFLKNTQKCFLRPEDFIDLFSIVEYIYKTQFSGEHSSEKSPAFEQLTTEEYLSRFAPEDKIYSTNFYNIYYQIDDPLEKSREKNHTIIVFEWMLREPVDFIGFIIMQFPKERPQSYRPIIDGISRINLDKNGLRQLIEIYSLMIVEVKKHL